jgi:hypothetical protein
MPLHQTVTDDSKSSSTTNFKYLAVFNVDSVFLTAVFGFMHQQFTMCTHTQQHQRVLHQTVPQLWHCNDIQTMISGFHCYVDKIRALVGYYGALCGTTQCRMILWGIVWYHTMPHNIPQECRPHTQTSFTTSRLSLPCIFLRYIYINYAEEFLESGNPRTRQAPAYQIFPTIRQYLSPYR